MNGGIGCRMTGILNEEQCGELDWRDEGAAWGGADRQEGGGGTERDNSSASFPDHPPSQSSLTSGSD